MSHTQIKHLSKDHQTEKRFKAYSKASAFVRHMHNKYDLHRGSSPDEASATTKCFKQQTPTNFEFKVSLLPRSQITDELKKRKEMLNNFQQLGSKRHTKRYFPTRSATPLPKKHKDRQEVKSPLGQLRLFSDIKNEHRRKCEDCRRFICECIDKTQDDFLKEILTSRAYVKREKYSGKTGGKSQVRIPPAPKRETEFFVSSRNLGAYSLFGDGSCTAIHTGKKIKFPIRTKKRFATQIKINQWTEVLDCTLSVSPISYSERPKTKDSSF